MESKTSGRRLSAEQTRANVLALRLAGATWREIGNAVGISHQRAHRLFAEVLGRTRKLTDEKAAQLREVEAQRLEAATKAIWARVIQGELAALDRFTRLSERRSALLGLDAPRGVQLAGPDGGPLRVTAGFDAWNIEALTADQLRTLREIEAAATGTTALAAKREGA